MFNVKVKMINVNDDSRMRSHDKLINSGAFGKIILGQGPDSEFVSKRFYFSRSIELMQKTAEKDGWAIQANFSDLETVLQEFAIAKVCSMFGIGPKILNPYGFDVVCYRNCAEFCMERCLPWSYGYSSEDKKLMERRLKYCVYIMHLLRIVHKDIKPSNIVFSPSVGDLVLCDFGISHQISEQIGFKTKTVQSGTFSFMSHEMALLSVVTPGYADLYYNDMHCLQVSLTLMERKQPEPRPEVSLPNNPLCKVFTTLYKIWLKQPLEKNQQIDQYARQFVKFFPEVNSLLASGVYYLEI